MFFERRLVGVWGGDVQLFGFLMPPMVILEWFWARLRVLGVLGRLLGGSWAPVKTNEKQLLFWITTWEPKFRRKSRKIDAVKKLTLKLRKQLLIMKIKLE